MRIGIDTTALPQQPVGAGNYIINLTRSLAKLQSGHEYVIITHETGKKLFCISDNRNLQWVVVSDKNPAKRLVWEQTHLPYLVNQLGVDLLHSLHYTRPIRLSCPSAVTFHDMTFLLYPEKHTWYKRHFFPLAIKLSAKYADAIITVSESTRRDSMELLDIPSNKIFTTQLGVSEKFRKVNLHDLKEEVRQKYKLPQKFLLYVGLIEPRKNIPLLIDAFKLLIESGVDQSLVIVGGFGWGYRNILKQIEKIAIKNKIHFTGYIPTKHLPVIYNMASVFVYPTYYEGFGFPPLEAMACGTPVVSTDVSSIPEIVGDAGILVPTGDVNALLNAVTEILENQSLREGLIRKGKKRASLFTWERTAQETVKVYDKLLVSL